MSKTCGCWLDSTYTLCKRQWSYSESLSFMGDNDRTTDSIHLLEVKLVVKTTNTFKIVTQVLPAMLLTIAKLTQSHGDTTTDHPTFANGLCQEQLPLRSKTNRRCTLVLLIGTTVQYQCSRLLTPSNCHTSASSHVAHNCKTDTEPRWHYNRSSYTCQWALPRAITSTL